MYSKLKRLIKPMVSCISCSQDALTPKNGSILQNCTFYRLSLDIVPRLNLACHLAYLHGKFSPTVLSHTSPTELPPFSGPKSSFRPKDYI